MEYWNNWIELLHEFILGDFVGKFFVRWIFFKGNEEWFSILM